MELSALVEAEDFSTDRFGEGLVGTAWQSEFKPGEKVSHLSESALRAFD